MIEYARHEARLNTLDDKGVRAIETYKEAARKGSKVAQEMLREREFPYSLGYLYDAAISLVGRSGIGMGGLSPLSNTEIRNYCELRGESFSALEVEVLMQLDAVMRHPEEETKEEKKVEPTPVAPWPERKK